MSIPTTTTQRSIIITTGNNSSSLTLRPIRPPSLIAPLTTPIGPRFASPNIRTITAPVSSNIQVQRTSTIFIGQNGQNPMAPRISSPSPTRYPPRPVISSRPQLISSDTIRPPISSQITQFSSPSRSPFQSRPIRPAPTSFQSDQPPAKVRLITNSNALVWENGPQPQVIPRPPLNRLVSPLERPLRYPRPPPMPVPIPRANAGLVPQFRARPLLPPPPPPLPLVRPLQPTTPLEDEQASLEPPKPKRRTAPLFTFGALPVPCRLSPQRIRMIMHSSPDVNVVSHESLMLTTKAAV